jgi:fermentation-respiration switch protein FrsA (DUF1100 family)
VIRWVAVALVLVAAGAALGIALLFRLQRVAMFPAAGTRAANANVEAAGGERLWLDADGARVEAYFLPPRIRSGERAPLLVYAHGNGELIDDWVDAFAPARDFGVGALLVEYPGYNRSEGTPSQASVAAAMRAAYDGALARPDVDPARIVGYGRSLGGGAVCALSTERPLAALVLESTFTSVADLAGRLGLPRFLVRDPFDNAAALARFAGPVLIIHGEHDEMIPLGHAHALHRLVSGSRLAIAPGCGHNDCPRPWELLREFLVETRLLSSGR